MAKHWTSYMMGQATQKQADYLDQIAGQLDALLDQRPDTETLTWRHVGSGRGLLEWSGCKGAPSKAEASGAIEFGLEKLQARQAKIDAANAAKTAAPTREAALVQIRALMAEHSITAADLA